jgi:transcriptional regulator with XRE-family HTH domain
MGRPAIPSTTIPAAVRAYYSLKQEELAAWLGVTKAFVSHVEAGRKALPSAGLLRLTPLAQHLPAAPAPTAALARPQPTDPAPATFPAPEPGPLEARLDYCRYHAARLRRQLRPLEARARYVARWQAALPALLATLPPDAAADTPAEARRRRWIGERAAPLTAADAATWHLLRLRAEGLETEAAALAALLPGGG